MVLAETVCSGRTIPEVKIQSSFKDGPVFSEKSHPGNPPPPPDLEVGDLRQRADSNLFPQPQNHDRRAGKGKIEDPSIHEPLSYQGVRKSQSPMAIHIEGRVTPCTTPISLLCVTLSCKAPLLQS